MARSEYGLSFEGAGLRTLVAGFACSCLLAAVPAAGDAPQAQAHADKGARLMQGGDLKGAEDELRRALELDPENAVYLGSLGAVLGMEKKLEESNVYLQKALRLNPEDWATRRNLASNQYQLGQLEPAKENLGRVLKAVPNDETTRLLLGMISEESKNYAAAVKWLSSVPDRVSQQPEAIVALARSYYNLQEAEKARETLRGLSAISVTRSSAEGVFLGARAAAQAGDYETAERMFTSIWSSYQDIAELGYHLALAQYHAGHIAESQATIGKVLAEGKETADVENLMGWCLYRQGDAKKAVEAMDRAIRLDPASENNYLDVGMMLIDQNRYAGGFEAAEKALEVAPDSYRAWRLKALAEAKLDRLKDAEESYQHAVELNPTDEQAILGLASEQLNDGKFEEAKHTLEAGIKRLPRDASLYQAYGRMLLWLQGVGDSSNNEARAVSFLQTALSLDSSLADPHYQLGKLALRSGRVAQALKELEAANRLDPRSAQTHYELAIVYRKLGRVEDADREMQSFMTLKAAEGRRSSGNPQGGTGRPELASPLERLSLGPERQ